MGLCWTHSGCCCLQQASAPLHAAAVGCVTTSCPPRAHPQAIVAGIFSPPSWVPRGTSLAPRRTCTCRRPVPCPPSTGGHRCSPARLCFHLAPLFVCVHADVPIDLLTATHPAAKSKVFPSSRCRRSPCESFCNPLSPLAARRSGPYPRGVQPFGGWFKSHGAAFIQKLLRSCPSPPISCGSRPWAADACCSSGCPLPGAAQALGARRASKIHG